MIVLIVLRQCPSTLSCFLNADRDLVFSKNWVVSSMPILRKVEEHSFNSSIQQYIPISTSYRCLSRLSHYSCLLCHLPVLFLLIIASSSMISFVFSSPCSFFFCHHGVVVAEILIYSWLDLPDTCGYTTF